MNKSKFTRETYSITDTLGKVPFVTRCLMGNIKWTKGLSRFMEFHKDMEMSILTIVEFQRYPSASCLWAWEWHIITILSLILCQFILLSFKNYLHRWLFYIHEWAVLFIFCLPALIFFNYYPIVLNETFINMNLLDMLPTRWSVSLLSGQLISCLFY